ncbi:MAG: hypothetical protein WEG40_14580 [Candidatus Rokuibacteriota bacterium]
MKDQSRGIETFLEPADIARTLELVPASVRYHIKLGHIVPAALTVRGLRLFRADAVETLRRHLRQRRQEKASK